MNRPLNFINTLLVVLFLTAGQGFAQVLNQKDSIILSAMQEELENNMQNLREDGFDQPFFIGYSVSDLDLKLASASFGALVSSKSTQNRDWNSRVMVGSYQLNDENFTDSFEGSSNDVYYENVPIGADYWGLRRVLWASTNNVYKRAARLFKQKRKAISDFKLEYPLSDFSQTPKYTYLDKAQSRLTSQEELERRSQELSGYIAGFDSIQTATAILTDIGARNYYYNSEGTKVIENGQVTIGLLTISRVNGKNEVETTSLDYFGVGLAAFPSIETIKQDIDWQVKHMEQSSSIEKLKEDYNGPVMLRGQAVADFFRANLFKAGKGILPNRKSFNNKNEESARQFFDDLEEDMTDEDKVKIGNKQMKVTMLNKLSEFEGIQLIGAYEIDADGVVPPEELVLIEGGMIRQKINGRVPAPYAPTSTGSNRFSIAIGSVSNLIAPGVIKVDFENKVSEAELVASFNERILENDAEEGVVIEMPPLHSMSRPRQYFLQQVTDGSRRQVKKASFGYTRKNSLKKIIAVSEEYYVYNFLYGGNQYGGANAGVPVSLIVPAAIVLRDSDVSKVNYKSKKLDTIVPQPGMAQE